MNVAEIMEQRNAFSFEVFPEDGRWHGEAVRRGRRA